MAAVVGEALRLVEDAVWHIKRRNEMKKRSRGEEIESRRPNAHI